MNKPVYLRKLLLSFFVLATFTANAQLTVYELMERTDISLQEAERIANRHFDTVGTGRGTGYKQFQRWLYERKFHIDENGTYLFPQTEWNRYLESRTSMGSLRTEAGSWTELGPWGWNRTSGWNPGTGRLSAYAIHPANENIIYVGSPGGGIWKSVNGGLNWAPLTDNNANWMSVFALTIDPVNQNIVYAGMSGSVGIIKSLNGGATWSAAGAGPSGTVRKILIHPSNTSVVFAAATNGIWRSVNAGASWTQVHSGSKEDIEFKPDDVNIMYATGNDVYRSTDNGVTWTLVSTAQGITNTGRTLVAVSPANPNYVYVVQASGSIFGRLYKSTDAGLSFITTVVGNPSSGTNYFGYETNGTGTTGQATYDMAMDVSPTNASEVHIAGIICWKSTNEGNNFTATTAWSLPNSIGYNHADVHGLMFVNNNLYSISDGGLYKSINNGDDWTDLSTGLGIRQFYRIASSPTNATVITGGAQDNGTAAKQASGVWVDWLGADGMEGLVSPTNHLNLWGTSQNGSIYRSTNGGNSYSGLPRPSAGQWVTPLAIHPTNETIVYGGWTGVYKSTNSGTSWTNISPTAITVTLADLAVAPSDPNYIYASTGSTLYVTTDDGATWATRTAPATINDIAVDPTNPSKIWIACNSTTNRVMVSTDAGATFTNVSSNLPAIVARAVVVDDNTPRGIYVGMNIGVYYKTEPDANWTNYSDNLPLVAINELEIQKLAGKIRVATYGRGVWESPVANAAGGFTFGTTTPATASCPAPSTMTVTLPTIAIGGFTNPISLTATAGIPSGTTVTFSPNPVSPGGSSIVSLNNANTLAAGTYVVTVTGTAASAPTQTANITFTINPGTGPAISSPPANQTICAGANTSFSITSAGATAFQWQLSTDGGVTFNNITNGGVYSNATTNTLNITSATAGMNTYRYRCVASTTCGSTNSAAGVLTVNTAPAITAQPQDVLLCAGSSHSFSVAATGAGLGYQWQLSTDGGVTYSNISGATNATYTITGVTAGMNGNRYRCVVSGTCTPSVNSNGAVLTVVTTVSVTSQPANAIVCDGSNTSFTVAGSGTGIIYQWQVNTGSGFTNISNGGIYSGASSATLTVSPVATSMNGYQYRCLLSNSTCLTPGVSNTATLTINSLPAISAHPQNATICAGSNNAFTVTASGTGIAFQWQVSTDGGVTFTNITGANLSSYTVTSATTAMNGNRYRCVVSGTCAPSVNSNSALLTVVAPVTVTTQPSNAETCSGGTAAFSVAGSSSGVIYQWQVSTDGGSTWTNISGASNATISLSAVTTGMNNNRYRCLLSNSTCTTPVASAGALLTVRQLPSVTLTAAPLSSLLPGQSTTLTATTSTSTGGTLAVNWYQNGTVFTNTLNTYVVNIEKIGAYQVRIQETFPGGLVCSNQSAVVNIDATASTRLFIFPSPNDGNFTVSYYNSSATSTQRTISIFDGKGALVFNGKFPVSGPYTLIPINLQKAQTGIYYVVVGDATGKKLAEGKVHVH
ncbi:MAG TPA: T9SS type A sorting domain-containing protein [Chitinophagaceae bacterium]|nr:T9SS type A sorting domain-containing protein [Chitinophagaceae bacterium]